MGVLSCYPRGAASGTSRPWGALCWEEGSGSLLMQEATRGWSKTRMLLLGPQALLLLAPQAFLLPELLFMRAGS